MGNSISWRISSMLIHEKFGWAFSEKCACHCSLVNISYLFCNRTYTSFQFFFHKKMNTILVSLGTNRAQNVRNQIVKTVNKILYLTFLLLIFNHPSFTVGYVRVLRCTNYSYFPTCETPQHFFIKILWTIFQWNRVVLQVDAPFLVRNSA